MNGMCPGSSRTMPRVMFSGWVVVRAIDTVADAVAMTLAGLCGLDSCLKRSGAVFVGIDHGLAVE